MSVDLDRRPGRVVGQNRAPAGQQEHARAGHAPRASLGIGDHTPSRPGSCRKARPRWLIAFFSAGVSSAMRRFWGFT